VRRRSSDSSEKLAVAVAGAQVDMNPHQVDAALFAFASPLSKGALLADEVGLGKTIEAGLVISQRWAVYKTPQEFYEQAVFPIVDGLKSATKHDPELLDYVDSLHIDSGGSVGSHDLSIGHSRGSEIHGAQWDKVIAFAVENKRKNGVYRTSPSDLAEYLPNEKAADLPNPILPFRTVRTRVQLLPGPRHNRRRIHV